MLRIKLSCPTHPRYNPADGEGAIRGACVYCQSMLSLYLQYLTIARREWEERHTEHEDEL